MTSRQTRFATACQQFLALAAVVALLLPAANVVSLDVIGDSSLSAPASPQVTPGAAAGDERDDQASDDHASETTDLPAEPAVEESADPQVVAEAAKVSDHEPATDPNQQAEVNTAPVSTDVTEYELEAPSAPVESAGPTTSARRSAGTGAALANEDDTEPDALLEDDTEPDALLEDEADQAPVSEEPAAEQPTAEESATEQPTADESAAGEPSKEQTAVPAEQEQAAATSETLPDGRTQLTAAPQDVTSFGTVGVTWDSTEQVAEGALTLQVRSRANDIWSQWTTLEYHDDHAPDSDETAVVRPGTEPLVVGDVDQVQVRAQSHTALPTGLRLAVVESRTAPTTLQAPAIDTAELTDEAAAATGDESAEATDGLALQAGAIGKAKQPVIYSRAQWGANESYRDPSSLRYGTINGAFVHHTVNQNTYGKDEVPSIIRGIYAYHTRSRGWSDIGYNFLIDRFGRIWEGRYGGVTKAPVGAHTLNYNDYSFAASAIGNYDIAKPSEATVNAYAALFAWKLGVNGVKANSTRQKIGRSWFPAINGHRDAGSTACPGRYLYARIPDIRSRAAALQAGTGNSNGNSNSAGNGTNLGNRPWTGAEIRSNLSNRSYPDLVVVRSSDKHAMALPTGGLTNFKAPRTVSTGWGRTSEVQVSRDLTGDRVADVLFVTGKGVLRVRRGLGGGKFGGSKVALPDFSRYRSPVAVGDLNGDGKGDMIAWRRSTGNINVFLGTGKSTFAPGRPLAASMKRYRKAFAAGDLTGDGKVDLVGVMGDSLYLHPGQGNGKFTPARQIAGSWGSYRDFAGGADFTGDGRADLVARDSSGRVAVFPSKGNGTFGAAYGPTRQSINGLASISTVGHLVDGAGSDLIGRQGDALVVVPNADTYEIGTPIDTGRNVKMANVVLNAGDWDRDGKSDMLTRNGATGALYVSRGTGGGKLTKGVRVAGGFQNFRNLSVIGDVTGDKYPDLVATGPTGKTFIYPGNGLKGLKPRLAAPVGAIMKLPVSTSAYDWVVPVSNLTRSTTRADVVAREKSTGRLYVLEAVNGFRTRRLLSESVAGYTLL